MKMLKRILRKTQFLSLCIISILIFISISIVHIEKIYRTMMEANNFKTINNVTFDFNEKNFTSQNMLNFLKKIQSNKDIVLIHDGGRAFYPGTSSFGIYFNGFYKNEYNLLEGRFFTKDDFKSKDNMAIIGKKLIRNIEVENNKKYIYRGNEKFLVIGIIGEEHIDTLYDSRILYNLRCDFNEKDKGLLLQGWILDSFLKDKDTLNKIMNKINEDCNNPVKIIESDKSTTPLISAISNSRFILRNFSLVIVCIILSLIKATSYWLDKITLEIGIRKMYGASNKNIILHIIKNYSIVSLFSLIICLLFNKILIYTHVLKIQYNITNIINLLVSIIFIFIIGVIIILIGMLKINKIEINELIKGRV
ncbi:ABC transporter permease [Clostridium lundense]|uniref:ABC transporter permease n=1 Tax=Clostridium lundense TaxID=319475 RepID=UPI0004802FF5|nr:ABC transporter permease [Clostridium lundense]